MNYEEKSHIVKLILSLILVLSFAFMIGHLVYITYKNDTPENREKYFNQLSQECIKAGGKPEIELVKTLNETGIKPKYHFEKRFVRCSA